MWTAYSLIEVIFKALTFLILALGASALVCWVVVMAIAFIDGLVSRFRRRK